MIQKLARMCDHAVYCVSVRAATRGRNNNELENAYTLRHVNHLGQPNMCEKRNVQFGLIPNHILWCCAINRNRCSKYMTLKERSHLQKLSRVGKTCLRASWPAKKHTAKWQEQAIRGVIRGWIAHGTGKWWCHSRRHVFEWKCDEPLSGKPRRAVSHIPWKTHAKGTKIICILAIWNSIFDQRAKLG